jgi:hypothetical protein
MLEDKRVSSLSEVLIEVRVMIRPTSSAIPIVNLIFKENFV